MGLMILTNTHGSIVLLALLVAAMALTYWETREHGFDKKHTIWWVLLVALVHVVGYIGLRLWLASQDRTTA